MSQPTISELLDYTLRQVDTHALALLDPAGVIVGWLAGSEHLFGYRPDEAIGQNISILFTPADRAKGIPEWEQKTAETSGFSEDDRWQVRKDGGWIWVSGTLTALHNHDGQLIGFAKIMRNQTDLKFQLEALDTRLSQLKQGQQQKNNFISTLAHELRNPLAAMSVANQLLAGSRSPSAAEIEFASGSIRRQVEFIGRLIDDLLEVTRSASGKVELRKERCILQEIIARGAELARPAIDARGHAFHQLIPESQIELNCDRVRLEQVFSNLLTNAAKYTPPGGTIWLKATIEGKEAVVRVQDTGVGIAPEAMSTIFDLFTQTGDTSHGLGIGLSLVRDIVSLHAGTVQANSDGLGKGAEFTVRLPMPELPQRRPQSS